MAAMRINTNYERSISFSPRDENKMVEHDEIHVYSKSTGEFLGSICPARVMQNAKHIYYKDRATGESKRSYFKIFSW